MNLQNIFVYGPFLVFAITFACFVLRCHLGVRAQAIWAMVLLAAFAKFFCYREIGGNAYTPEFSEPVIWIWNCLYSGAFILGVLAVLTFFIPVPHRVIVLPLVAWVIAIWGVWNGCSAPSRTREVTLEYPDLPENLDGYRIVQVSDIHVSSAARRWRTEQVVARANACRGDLIVLTGDFVDGDPERRLRDVMPLKNLSAPDGVYAVTGNHEKYFNFSAWLPWYEKWGIHFLFDACVFPRRNLAIAGVDDPAVSRVRPGKVLTAAQRQLDRAFSSVTNGAFRVLLQHRPQFALDNARRADVRLQLSGHTHGGIMPGFDFIVRWHNGDFVRGLYDLNGGRGKLYVSSGVGQWAGFPIRFFNPTEITVFTLRRRSQK